MRFFTWTWSTGKKPTKPVWTDLARFLKKGPSTESLGAWIQISLPNHSEEEGTRVKKDEPVSAGFCWWKGSRFGFQLASWNVVFGIFRPFDPSSRWGVLLWTLSSPWASTTRFPWRSMLSTCHCLMVLKRFSKSPHFLSEMTQMTFRWPKKVQVSPLVAFEVQKNAGPQSLCVVLVKSTSTFSCNRRVLVPYLEFTSWYFGVCWPLNGTKCHGWLVDIPRSYSHHPALTNNDSEARRAMGVLLSIASSLTLGYLWCNFASVFFFALDSCGSLSCIMSSRTFWANQKLSEIFCDDFKGPTTFAWRFILPLTLPTHFFLRQFPVNNGMIPRFWWPAWTIIAWL